MTFRSFDFDNFIAQASPTQSRLFPQYGGARTDFDIVIGAISVFVHFVALGSRFLNKINRLRQSHFPRPRCFSCSLWRCVGVATHDAPRDPARRHSLAD
jgi:hypothetical protein